MVFRTLSRLLLPNPLDALLKKTRKRGGKNILLGWNRGLGDIALGLYAIIQRIREYIPDAKITFLTRENLQSGFSLLENIEVLVAPHWRRGNVYSVKKTLLSLSIDPKAFDLMIEQPSPTDWVSWQRGHVVPKLKWDPKHDDLWKKFDLSQDYTYIAVQVAAETNYGLWRNWPLSKWHEFFSRLEALSHVRVLLFGFGTEPTFSSHSILDLRGKTTLFEFLSIVKNQCKAALLPDSGLLSMIYYLDVDFPFQLISLWADPNHGILKQAVASPNRQLIHQPVVGERRDLSTVSVTQVMNLLFPVRPLTHCVRTPVLASPPAHRAGALLLAGGQGSRLGITGPKGTFLLGKKSLFQWICEKLPQEHFPLAIMTSPLNHEETVSFFREHHNFDREIYFFQQGVLPLLDVKKRPLKALGPNGNGDVFRAFKDSGLGTFFKEKKIDVVTILPVDNPLANPYDLDLITHHLTTKSDVTIQCIERNFPQEPMGALIEREGRIEIVEYLHLDPEVQYRYAYLGVMAMSLSFLSRMADQDLPLHLVAKRFRGRSVLKREKFIFDSLAYATKVEALAFPRQACYAPIKNMESLNSELLKPFILSSPPVSSK